MTGSIRAGFSKVDITPPLQRVEAYGIGYWYQRHVRFTGVRDPLFARALVAGVGPSRHVVVSVDSIFDAYGFTENASTRVAEDLDIPRENIFITCTHTHSSPLIDRNNTRRGVEYGKIAADGIVQSVLEAAENARDTWVTIAMARIEGVLYNRRPLLKNGSIAELHRPLTESDIADSGPVNDLMTMVNFRDSSGVRIGGLCHFGIHGVAMQCSELLSSDCMGRALQALEQEHTSLVLLHLNGACGDIDPARMGDEEALREMTARLTAGIQNVMNTGELPVSDLRPTMALRRSYRAKRRSTRDEPTLKQERERLAAASNADGMQHHSGAGYELFLLAEEEAVAVLPEQFEISYQILRWGGIILVGIGGEVFTRSGLALQAALPGLVVLPVGLTGGAAGYLPLSEMYAQGGYEPACAQWCPIAPGEAELLFAQVAEDLRTLAEVEAA